MQISEKDEEMKLIYTKTCKEAGRRPADNTPYKILSVDAKFCGTDGNVYCGSRSIDMLDWSYAGMDEGEFENIALRQIRRETWAAMKTGGAISNATLTGKD